MKTTLFKKEWAQLKAGQVESTTGKITYARGRKWTKEELAKHGVPKGYGVYAVYGLRGGQEDHLLYIGMAGTVASNGQMRDQGIAGRLSNKAFTAEKIPTKKVEVFEYLISGDVPGADRIKTYYSGIDRVTYEQLRIEWIETYVDGKGVLPRLAEACLLSAYFLENCTLPPLNKEF